jgi:hypothetical protein
MQNIEDIFQKANEEVIFEKFQLERLVNWSLYYPKHLNNCLYLTYILSVCIQINSYMHLLNSHCAYKCSINIRQYTHFLKHKIY